MAGLFPLRAGRVAALGLFGLLAACSDPELILPGEREPVRPDPAPALAETAEIPPLTLPPSRRNSDWTHVGGSSVRLPGHLSFSTAPERAWSVSLGAGASRRMRVAAPPVVAGGRIYAFDAAGQASAVALSGALLWRTDLAPEGEARGDGFGGGFAFADGVLVATTGFGEVLRLDPATGDVIWRTRVEAAIRAAPAISAGRIVAVARNDVAHGLDAETGQIDWRIEGVGLGAGLLGGSSPAIRGRIAIIPFQSGEVIAALTESGRRVWSAALTSGRRELVRSRIADISGDPVIDDVTVYAANQAGQVVALDRRSGDRLWTQLDGSYGPVLPVGTDTLFMVSDKAELLRLDAANGQVIWRQPLPEWRNPAERREAIPHFGPLLAGGRLLVASGDGLLRSFDPATGRALAELRLPSGVATPPALVDGTLYLVTDQGSLHAYR
ncbi:MAG: PQQ-binding-like beta-propeller repeat protein [Pseudomonadota bacterium]